MRDEGQAKGFLKRTGIAVIGGAVGGFLEQRRRRFGVVSFECDPPQHNQPPGGERMVELIAHDQPAFQQRNCLLQFSLRPQRCAECDVEP